MKRVIRIEILATAALLLAVVQASSAQDLVLRCPVNEVSDGIVTPLPEDWWNTPRIGRIARVEVRQLGGDPLLTCLYRFGDDEVAIMRRPPENASACEAQAQGFSFVCRIETASAPPSELQGKICQASIQDQVEWDYQGNSRWARSNLETICRNAEDSLQPGVCFKRVMHGNIDHGNGTRWRWRSALRLCAGTRNAYSTINCFKREIENGKPWQEAIELCRVQP